MSEQIASISVQQQPESGILHPLDPLTAEEIAAAVAIVRDEPRFNESMRFVSINLNDPAKEQVLFFQAGNEITREAKIILLDNSDGATYELVISLSRGQVAHWTHIPGVQPSVMLDEFFECEQTLRKHPDFQAALRRRGITDYEQVMVEPWSAGNYGDPEEQQRRLVRVLSWVRMPDPNAPHTNDNGYAHPIEGLRILFDLNRMEIVRIEDDDVVVPVPTKPANYTPEAVGQMRSDLKDLAITQPDGPSFQVHGHEVAWQKWRFHVGFNSREGLVLSTVSYQDQGRKRPILYRASLAEMVVPYGDPSEHHYRKNAFDVGEYGVGCMANALELGCDCLGHIYYFDAYLANSRGEVLKFPNVICMHEEDYGLLWKHTDWRTNETEVRRSRRLVVSFIATVGNYDYGFYWYFYQDGNIGFEIKLTGLMNTGSVRAGEQPKYGTLVEPEVFAPNHQHIFSVRLDMSVDGYTNSVYEVNTQADPIGPSNPYGNGFYATATQLENEQEAQRVVNPFTGRTWKVVNPNVRNRLGTPVAYGLTFDHTTLPLAHPESSVGKRAGFIHKNLWVTPYHPEERYPAGDYPNQHKGGAGLPDWTQANRSLVETNVVLWCTMNIIHIPKLEDWPLMPVHTIGLHLKPVGFFDRNPGLDVPAPTPQHECCDH